VRFLDVVVLVDGGVVVVGDVDVVADDEYDHGHR
jgi:hypothetical protein